MDFIKNLLPEGTIFGAPEISNEQIVELSKTAPNLIVWAVPVMLLLTGLEMWFSHHNDHDHYSKDETIGSTLVGLGSLVVSAALKFGLIYLTVLVYNLVPWRMELNWWTLIPCYIIYDLASYWAHRVSHESRLFWATHVVHHSAEHYNLTVSYRLSWIQHIKVIFFMPVMLFGFHPVIFFVTNQLATLFQFLQHTEYIRRLHPVLEYIFATPSNHRVHHGSQEKYIDKNFGATFIFWDRIFNTYTPEEEQVIYGITTNIDKKANPLHINFHELNDIVSDVRQSKNLKEAWMYTFGSPITVYNLKIKAAHEAQQRELEVYS
ncbi:sterol desaturase family protein [Spirosoma rhododendri]|uniref:sterol desaturase family protein n=1 Tax=Spirosoma rhododendri TaxID=2728024 RepID=UPI0020C3770A|nr:sterol desaturase family protein [Spirosoma rhododendri]